MFTITAGRAAVALHNLRHGTDLSERQFFDEVFHRLFFDDKRYLLWINNSPIHQPHVYKKANNPTERAKALLDLHTKIHNSNTPLGHLTIGGKAENTSNTTTGQYNTPILVSSSDTYCSWIGAGLGIRVSGGLCFVINDEAIINALTEGWFYYRKWLQQSSNFEGKQIETWNGWWIIHYFSNKYNPENPLDNFTNDSELINKDNSAFNTPPWTKVLFYISKAIKNSKATSFVYALGNTNKTVGFVVFDVPAVRNIATLYASLFGAPGTAAKSIADVWESEFGFQRACALGVLGLRALQPKGLRPYLQKPDGKAALPPRASSDKHTLTYRQYITWIIAMLNNNKDLLALAEDVAQAYHSLSVAGARGQNIYIREVEAALEASSRKPLIEALTPLVERSPQHAAALNRLVETVVTMPAADVPLLLALIRFKYALHGQTL